MYTGLYKATHIRPKWHGLSTRKIVRIIEGTFLSPHHMLVCLAMWNTENDIYTPVWNAMVRDSRPEIDGKMDHTTQYNHLLWGRETGLIK